MDLCYRMGLLQSIHSPSINMGGFQCCGTGSCNLTGAFREIKTGGEGRDSGPGNVRTSNVLQNMQCVESFPLGYVGFCLFCLG